MMHLYEVKFIHRLHDWDAFFRFQAPDAKTARKWARYKLANRADWIAHSAKRVFK